MAGNWATRLSAKNDQPIDLPRDAQTPGILHYILRQIVRDRQLVNRVTNEKSTYELKYPSLSHLRWTAAIPTPRKAYH